MKENTKYVKIEVFVPEGYIEALRDKLSQAGAGQIGNYDHCVSVTAVTGYWRPLPGAEPYEGEIGKISAGQESKLEVNCPQENLEAALEAIREVHPYDRPLINILPLLNHRYET